MISPVNGNYYNSCTAAVCSALSGSVSTTVDTDAVQEELKKQCDDGSDDGKIGVGQKIWSAICGAAKSVGKGLASIVSSPGNFLKAAALTVACFIPGVNVVVGAAMGIYGLIKGGIALTSAVKASDDATTDAEAKAAWENIGSSSFQIAASAVGTFASFAGIGRMMGNTSTGAMGAAWTGLKNVVRHPIQTISTALKTAGQSAFGQALKSIGSSVKNAKGILGKVKAGYGATKEALSNTKLGKLLKKKDGDTPDAPKTSEELNSEINGDLKQKADQLKAESQTGQGSNQPAKQDTSASTRPVKTKRYTNSKTREGLEKAGATNPSRSVVRAERIKINKIISSNNKVALNQYLNNDAFLQAAYNTTSRGIVKFGTLALLGPEQLDEANDQSYFKTLEDYKQYLKDKAENEEYYAKMSSTYYNPMFSSYPTYGYS